MAKITHSLQLLESNVKKQCGNTLVTLENAEKMKYFDGGYGNDENTVKIHAIATLAAANLIGYIKEDSVEPGEFVTNLLAAISDNRDFQFITKDEKNYDIFLNKALRFF